MKFHLRVFTFLLTILLMPQPAYSLVGSQRAGKGWEGIVFIEFQFNKNSRKTSCTGFLINASQAITVGHCAYNYETNIKAKSAIICIGRQRPFNRAGEGCFKSKRIQLAKNYQYNRQTDMAIIDLLESIPLNFLGIKPLQLISAKQAEKIINYQDGDSNELRIFSFGSRNFNSPTLGKKGWIKAHSIRWNKITGLLEASAKGSVFGLSDDGAGLFLKTSTGWKLVGLMSSATPDFFISVQPFFDPCLPPEPSPRQPDIKLTSTFNFVSVNKIACSNNFFNSSIKSNKLCNIKPLTTKQITKQAIKNDPDGKFSMELYFRSSSPRDKLKWLNKASEKENGTAMLLLVDKYTIGEELRKNPTKALALITKAAGNGYAEAEYQLASLLKAGILPKSNLKGSWTKWMYKAAQQGHAAAQFEYAQSLKSNYNNGIYEWLMRSARQGFANAQYQLGTNYYYGNHSKKDRYIGSQWIEYAAGQGHLEASQFLVKHPIKEQADY